MTAPDLKLTALRSAARVKKFLTTSEAAAITGYASDHLALLLRRNVLRGERKGRDWFVESSSLLDYVNAEPRPGPKRG
jgi:hypothetical protein